MRHDQRRHPIGREDLGRDRLREDRRVHSPARELDLRGQVLARGGQQVDLEALHRLGLLGPRDVRRPDLVDPEGPERGGQGRRLQHRHDPLLEGEDLDSSDIEIHVLGVAAAAEEETQVAATLQRQRGRGHRPAQRPQEGEVEDLAFLGDLGLHNMNRTVWIATLHDIIAGGGRRAAGRRAGGPRPA